MDLKTFKEKLEKLGSQNNHLIVVNEAGEAFNDVGIFEHDGNLVVIVGMFPEPKPAEKTNAAGVPISLQKHAIPEDQIGRFEGVEPVKFDNKDKPTVDSTTGQIIPENVQPVTSDPDFDKLEEIK